MSNVDEIFTCIEFIELFIEFLGFIEGKRISLNFEKIYKQDKRKTISEKSDILEANEYWDLRTRELEDYRTRGLQD